MRFLIDLAWRDLRSSGRSLWVFCACLTLGVTLVSAAGGLYRLIQLGLLADTRALLGGDVEVDANRPLPDHVLEWMADNGEICRVTEVDTMLATDSGGLLRVELQAVAGPYPLYGELRLEPAKDLSQITANADQYWGVAIDPVLADRLGIGVGDSVYVGSLAMKVRALILNQPDRSLNADWRGTPVLLSDEALRASGLIQPGSRIDYDYRVRTRVPAETWRKRFYDAFPNETWEVRTFRDRSRRLSERLGQIGSGLLIIGFSTLFIGGLGVFNSIQAYLQSKLKTIATLRALGLRNRRLATVYLLQVGFLSAGASLLGTAIGSVLGLAGALVVAAQIPMAITISRLLAPNLLAVFFGLLTAYAFALPAIGRALSVEPAALFRGADKGVRTPRGWWLATSACAASIVLLVLLALPDAVFGLGFVFVIGLVLMLLEAVVRGIRRAARSLDEHPALANKFEVRLAMANLHRPGSPLRSSLLSLGSALTLLVACTLVVASLIRTVNTTIPAESPALVLYDVGNDQLQPVVDAMDQFPGAVRIETAPLVRSRIVALNGQSLDELYGMDRGRLRHVSQDEYKLSYTANNIDSVTIVDGEWSANPVAGAPKLAMEDREADQLGLRIGDVIRFAIEGRTLDAEVAAIFSQKGMQTKFWFEGILSDGALDGYVHRHVGAAYMADTAAIAAQQRIAEIAPNVITVRTAALLASARNLLAKAAAGLALVATVSLAASLLVLISVMAAGRTRQIYAATILHSLGARLAIIKRGLHMEYLLLASITSVFAVLLGSAIALPLLHLRLKLPSEDLVWLGIVTAVSVSGISLSLGARYLLRRLQPVPAILLRNSE